MCQQFWLLGDNLSCTCPLLVLDQQIADTPDLPKGCQSNPYAQLSPTAKKHPNHSLYLTTSNLPLPFASVRRLNLVSYPALGLRYYTAVQLTPLNPHQVYKITQLASLVVVTVSDPLKNPFNPHVRDLNLRKWAIPQDWRHQLLATQNSLQNQLPSASPLESCLYHPDAQPPIQRSTAIYLTPAIVSTSVVPETAWWQVSKLLPVSQWNS